MALAGCNLIPPFQQPPLFRQHPESVTVRDGATATFTAVFNDYWIDLSAQVRWSIDGVEVAGASDTSFSRVFTYADNGRQIRASGWQGPYLLGESNPATVTVLPVAPNLSGTLPTTVTLPPGAKFDITAPPVAGTVPVTYQWSRDGLPIAGATASSYTLAAVAATDSSAQFSVTVANIVGSVASNACILIVQ